MTSSILKRNVRTYDGQTIKSGTIVSYQEVSVPTDDGDVDCIEIHDAGLCIARFPILDIFVSSGVIPIATQSISR